MTDQHLRFTGDFPPLDVLERFPNWENALDEEEVEGQDETTIRPTEEQHVLTPEVVFTAGVIIQADGTWLPAMWKCPPGRSKDSRRTRMMIGDGQFGYLARLQSGPRLPSSGCRRKSVLRVSRWATRVYSPWRWKACCPGPTESA